MHVNALLADQLVQHHEYLASLQTATISQDRNHCLAEATDFTDSKTSEDRHIDESEVLEPEKETQALDRVAQSIPQSKDKPLAKGKALADLDGNSSDQELLGEPEELATVERAAEATLIEFETGEESRVHSPIVKRPGSPVKLPCCHNSNTWQRIKRSSRYCGKKLGVSCRWIDNSCPTRRIRRERD
jgi:hypothetical protein